MEIRRIETDDPLYPQSCALREEVLLRAVGFTFERFRDEYGVEDKAEHFVAVIDHPTTGPRVVGTALLIPGYPEPGCGKVAQVAVHDQRRGEGIGRQLMIAIEARAFGQLRLSELFCHAQITAVPFYDSIGWLVEGDEFTEAGIPHLRMIQRSTEPDAASGVDPDPD